MITTPSSQCKRCNKLVSSPGAFNGYCRDCNDVVTTINRAITELKKKALTTSEPFEKNRLLNEIKAQEKRRDKV